MKYEFQSRTRGITIEQAAAEAMEEIPPIGRKVVAADPSQLVLFLALRQGGAIMGETFAIDAGGDRTVITRQTQACSNLDVGRRGAMTATETVVGRGKYTYQVDENWAKLPANMDMPAAAVTVDSQNRVYCFNRSKDNPVVVFGHEGNYLWSWGAGVFAPDGPHAIRVAKDDNLWTVDRDRGQVMLFTPQGEMLQAIGIKGFKSDTGAPLGSGSRGWKSVTHGGTPFNLPTDIAVAPSGDLFVSDGYGNARMHKFAADGTYLTSWGEPGTEPGQFNLPHGVWIDRAGRVMVADRENDRIQRFDQEGKFLDFWKTAPLVGPAFFYVDPEDIVYIPEHNAGLISVLAADGQRLAQWGDESFRSCHGIWGDSHGDIYVVRPGAWSPTGGRSSASRRVVKYTRIG